MDLNVSSSSNNDQDSVWNGVKWAVGLTAGAIFGYKIWIDPLVREAMAETLLIEAQVSAVDIITNIYYNI
jgi:hypothetical protein